MQMLHNAVHSLRKVCKQTLCAHPIECEIHWRNKVLSYLVKSSNAELKMSNNGLNHHNNQHNNHQPNFDLLEDWFEECERLGRPNDADDGDQLEKLVEILNDDQLTKLIYQILEDPNYHEQVGGLTGFRFEKQLLRSAPSISGQNLFLFMILIFGFN